MTDIKIIQYNCGNTNHKATRPFFDGIEPEDFQIIAVQEPAYMPHNKATYCPKGFHLASTNTPTTRACFMVSKTVPIQDWQFHAYDDLVAAIHMRAAGGTLTIINVYNPRERSAQIRTWNRIQEAIEAAEGEVILLGDFNTHHPQWGGSHIASEQQAERLLVDTETRGLHLLTEPGVATWRRNSSESVIDLTFATRGIRDSVQFCGPNEQWALTQDHIPIEIRLARRRLTRDTQTARRMYRLDKADWGKITQHIENSKWDTATSPIETLQEVISDSLQRYCPVSRRGPYSNPKWSPRASELIAGARRARRRYHESGNDHDRTAMQSFQNLLQKELRRTNRANWRRFVSELTADTDKTKMRGLWKMSKWSRRHTGDPPTDIHLPALRRSNDDQSSNDDREKAQILAEKFFPIVGQADLSDIASETLPESRISIPLKITKEILEEAITHLPKRKAPGPDTIPNEVLQRIRSEIQEGLAQAMTRCLVGGQLPPKLKESHTVVLRKERKQDYSLPSSYRPIALENTIAKLLEKIIADRLAQAAEEHQLLPWAQMGARKHRSTLTAIELLTACTQTTWKARRGGILSMLCLDIKGAFDNVSHERLLWILRKKGLPDWIVSFVSEFLTGRRTKLLFSGHLSEWISTPAGIPQGSPLSPILFLFFISELLESLQGSDGETLAFGFVDDTHLITWGASAADNCRRLEAAHDRCIAWAKRHGAQFAPEKYQLIHLTRRKRDPSGDLASTVRINDVHVTPETTVKVLGVLVDSKLSWRPHIQQAATKGLRAYQAMARLMAATWGPSVRQSRLIYSAVVRPSMMYGAQVWSPQDDGGAPAKGRLKPLAKVQNKCLRTITGAYKRTPIAAIEREMAIPPIDLYADAMATQRSQKTKAHPVAGNIKSAVDKIWEKLRPAGAGVSTQRKRGRPARQQPRPPTTIERIRSRAEDQQNKAREYQCHLNDPAAIARRRRAQGDRPQYRKAAEPTAWWMDFIWRRRWAEEAKGRRATTWVNHWDLPTLRLYDGLPKYVATALFLLRTEVIGLNAWLASIHVPGILPRCECGWATQTVRHTLLFCPRHSSTRAGFLSEAGSEDLTTILSKPASAHLAARWLIESGALAQFRLAQEIEGEDTTQHQRPLDIRNWT